MDSNTQTTTPQWFSCDINTNQIYTLPMHYELVKLIRQEIKSCENALTDGYITKESKYGNEERIKLLKRLLKQSGFTI